MTTVQLFQRLGRRARGGDFTKLSLTEQGDLAEAANSALQRVYEALPIYFKEQTQGFVLLAPQPITGVGVTQNSNILGSNVFDVSRIGCSVALDGDPAWNTVLGPNLLLNPYLGATGTVSGTLYGDAVYSTTLPFDRIIGDPKFANQTAVPMFNMTISRTNGSQMGWGWVMPQTVGRPQTWGVMLLGNAQGNTPLLVMKFSPAPDIAYAINVRLGFWPKRLTLADYDAATTIPVPDQFIETALIPMGLDALISTPIWESRKDEQIIMEKAEFAEEFLRRQPGQVAAPSNRVFTPIGY